MKFTKLFIFLSMITWVGLNFSYAQAPTLQWLKQSGGTTADLAFASVVDASGNIYSVGQFSNTATFNSSSTTLTSNGGSDIFIQKVDPSGNLIWVKQIGGQNADTPVDIEIDDNGNIYIIGHFSSHTDFDPGPGNFTLMTSGLTMFFLKLDSAGDFVWAHKMGFNTTTLSNLTIDSDGNIYIIGKFTGPQDFDPGAGTYSIEAYWNHAVFILKLDAGGNFVWARHLEPLLGSGTYYNFGSDIVADKAGYLYIAGNLDGTADFDPSPTDTVNLTSNGSADIFILKLDTAANFVWVKTVGGSDVDNVDAIKLDGLGNIYSVGRFRGTTDFDPSSGSNNLTSNGNFDLFIQKLDTSGNYLWAHSFGGSGVEEARDVNVDTANHVYLTGFFQSTVDFDPGTGTNDLTSMGSEDAFLLKLSPMGDFGWINHIGSTAGNDRGISITITDSSHIYLNGYFSGTATFDINGDTSMLTSNGNFDFFQYKLGPDVMNKVTSIDPSNNVLNIYPNPSEQNITIELAEIRDQVNVQIIDATGKTIETKTFTSTSRLDLSINGAPGVYFIKINTEKEQNTLKIIKK